MKCHSILQVERRCCVLWEELGEGTEESSSSIPVGFLLRDQDPNQLPLKV